MVLTVRYRNTIDYKKLLYIDIHNPQSTTGLALLMLSNIIEFDINHRKI